MDRLPFHLIACAARGCRLNEPHIPLRVQSHQLARKVPRIMAHEIVFHRHHRAADDLHAQRLAGLPVAQQRLGALGEIALGDAARDGRVVCQTDIK